ncbi:hypothetical protein LEP1GSC050_1089 [Leptospira broomii serovar Hurstbridge str. 5399]|uniref:Uncharacterized protein n=1 Tax=Leptospira broomii serovar Hurstbridge str. 5399 TaxID=1049789 RepID=T0F7A7_9LEPT|nr:hypothetical protein [Leptospira broomii]EQA47000.1 hypothetical protein LEP1GSC050_1089 [Leptospira broomii serovar Hurstbridge str. 5399]
MEKLRLSVYLVIAIIVVILVYALLKSWFVYDRGIEISKSSSNKSETVYVEPDDDLLEHSSVAWGRFLYYPLNLNRDRENFGPRKTLNHAQNLVVVDLLSGKIRKVFTKSVYIWDYFYAQEETEIVRTNESVEPNPDAFPGLQTGRKFIVVGMPEDTNKDGYLNQKDSKKVFVYDPITEELIQVLPKKHYLEKFLPDSPKDRLVMIVRREEDITLGGKKKPSLPTVFIYDTASKKGQLVARP